MGVKSGYIGWKQPVVSKYQYRLTYAEMRNTLATEADNRPYDFNIEIMDRYGVWTVVQQVRGFNSYVYSKSFDSEYVGHGFRINVLECQPGFDSDINAVEIKQIKFRVKREEVDIYRAGHGIFVTTGETDYTFSTGDSDVVVSGLLIGAGGGGGDNGSNADPYGAGGGGGGIVRIHNLVLPRNRTYSLRVGRGGPSNTDGNPTTLRDVTNNRVILSALGGRRGNTANWPNGTTGGLGGDTVADSDNYVFTVTRLNGGQGGDSGASGEGGTGRAGYKVTMKQFVHTQQMNDLLNVDICAGGGGGANANPTFNWNGGQGGGASAGRGAGWSWGSTSGTANRGGGGGGAGDQNGRAGASGGGSGYAYLVFK